jgi:hypothetical protein
MKTKQLLIVGFFLLLFFKNYSQESAPTLTAGLDNVAFNKGTLDVELITKIISEKQKEIVREGIKRMIFKFIGDSRLDDYSQFYTERITEILFNESNHKVMTKRILEESTNYLFVLGATKLILDSNNSEFKSLLISNNNISDLKEISNLEERNKVIKTVLTICSEVPQLKKIGLLNNYNYYEHFKIYEKSIVKEYIDDFKVILNQLKPDKINIVFANNNIKNTILEINILVRQLNINNKPLTELIENNDFKENNVRKIKLKEDIIAITETIKILNKNSKKIGIKSILEKQKLLLGAKQKKLKEFKKFKKVKLNKKIEQYRNLSHINNIDNIKKKIDTQIDDLISIINKEYKINLINQKKNIIKLFENNLFSTKNFQTYSKVNNIITFLQELLKDSNILKNVITKSGIDFDFKEKSLDEIIKKFSSESKEVDLNKLFINIEQIKPRDTLFILKINKYKKIIKNFEKRYNNKIEDYDSIIYNINKLKNISFNSNDTISFDNKKIKINEFETNIRNIKNLFKLNLELSNFYNENISYYYSQNNDDNVKNSNVNKLVAKVGELNFALENFDNYYNNGFKKKIDTTYKYVRNFYKIIEYYNKKTQILDIPADKDNKFLINFLKNNPDKISFENVKNYHNQYINKLSINLLDNNEGLKKIDASNLNYNLNKFIELIITNNINKNQIIRLIKEKLLVTNFDVTDKKKLTEKEKETLKKLNSFFLDRNLNNKLGNLEILNYFDNNFFSDLLSLKQKLKHPDKINKLIYTLQYSISSLISEKLANSKGLFNNVNNIENIKYFIKFIGNIKDLGKAETFSFLLKTMNDYEYLFANANGSKKIIPDLINSLREYAIIDLNNNSIEIDVASVLTHIVEKYQKSRRFSFYATVGLNQFWTNTDLVDNNGDIYNSFNAASEKIGAKFKIWNFNETPLLQNKLIHNVKRKALVSDIYTMAYISGVLYKIANTSGRDYNSANVGLAFGLTFFNSLDLNFSYSIPMEGKVFQNSIMGISFDIPLSEYLKRL